MSMIIQESAYDAWLASVCLPCGMLIDLLEHYGSAFHCYEAFEQHDETLHMFIPARFYQLLANNANTGFIRKMSRAANRNSIKTVHIMDEDYPDTLRSLDDPPAILFYQGELECTKDRILSMVGSRAASYAGQKAARRLAEDLSRNGVTVVSGLASGIDASAHKGCIDGKSPTIAVLGCGLDRPYPADNLSLRDEILNRGGLILSEYAPGEKAYGWHFPVRNRIIVGLSQALILMEARIRSGSMTSVRHALDQGKDVFVYPGDPLSEYYEGNHQLLREGGTYFTSAFDILEDMHWLDNPPSVRQNSDCVQAYQPSSPEEQAVIKALKPGALSFEQLIASTDIDPSVLMSTLTILQIRGMIDALPGKHYQLKQ